jgi:NAD(P)H-dependent FMN reductase
MEPQLSLNFGPWSFSGAWILVLGAFFFQQALYIPPMPDSQLNVLAVIGSLHKDSVTRVVLSTMADELRNRGCTVDILDFEKEPLPLYNPDTSYSLPEFPGFKKRVDNADVFLLGTPDYHGCISSVMKSFLDHFWREFAGKLFATVVASHEKGLTVTDQLRTVARQCYAWSLPYGLSFIDGEDVKNGVIISKSFEERMTMMAHDIAVYGKVLTQQRKADLLGSDPTFLARHRTKG